MGEVSLGSLGSFTELGGVAVVAIAFLYFGFQAFKIIIDQWRRSTEAVDRNTKSFENLAMVFEKQSIREVEFQKEVLTQLKEGHAIIADTHDKVTDIHRKTFIMNKGE